MIWQKLGNWGIVKTIAANWTVFSGCIMKSFGTNLLIFHSRDKSVVVQGLEVFWKIKHLRSLRDIQISVRPLNAHETKINSDWHVIGLSHQHQSLNTVAYNGISIKLKEFKCAKVFRFTEVAVYLICGFIIICHVKFCFTFTCKL